MNIKYLPALFGLALLCQGATQSWTIGNDRIVRTLEFSDESGLQTRRLADLTTHHEFVEPVKLRPGLAAEFSFQCTGRSYRGASSQFSLIGGEQVTSGGAKALTIRLRAKDMPLEVSATYGVYDGHPAIRKYLTFRNTGNVALRIWHLSIEAIAPTVGPENETTLNTQYGTVPREIMYTGRSEDAGLLIANGRTGVGFAVISEVPGYMKRTEIGGWDEASHVPIGVMYDTDLMPFARSIAPGGEFKTAAVSLVTFKNGDGFQDPHWVLPSYAARVLMRKVDVRGAPWIYNTWEPFERGINRATVEKLVDAASRMGLDIFTIDDGWQQEYGANDVNLAAFPGGLKPVQELVEAKGMRLGLWIPLAAIGTATKEYKEHPEWAATDQEGKQKITGTAAGPKAVMCLASPFRDSAAARVNQAIDEFHLAYVKLDLTTIFNAYGEAPGCWRSGHDHQGWAESLNMIYEGISYVTSKVYEKHPDVLLDLTSSYGARSM